MISAMRGLVLAAVVFSSMTGVAAETPGRGAVTDPASVSAALPRQVGAGTERTVLPDGSVVTTVPLVAARQVDDAAAAGPPEFSPAGCRIVYVDTPHFSASVPGAVKVNAKVQCSRPVPELTLSVTLVDETNGRPARKTVKEARNKRFILNQDTFVSCVNSATTRYSGAALASSYENGELYTNIDTGPSVDRPCGYR